MRTIFKQRAVVTLIAVVVALGNFATFAGTAGATADSVDEIHYSFGNTPDSVAFDWRGTENTIYYGADTNYGNQAVATPPTVTPVDNSGPFEEVQISGLQAGTTYHYKIGTNGLDHTFQTIPTDNFTWADMGDTGTTLCEPWMAQTHALVAAQNPNFVTHGGDISYANDCGVGAVHQYYLDQQAWSDSAAFQPVLGNHEYGKPGSEGPMTAPPGTPQDSLLNYKGRDFITNPQTVPSDTQTKNTNPGCGWETGATTNTCQGEDWGWFQAGHVLFISYPEPWTNAYPAWQTKADSLMAAAQANQNIDFIVTYGHRPNYSSVASDTDTNLRTAIDNLALKYSPTATNPNGKYVLNVNHHVHWEEVFKPINGLVNITDGGGGAAQVNPTTFDPNSIFHMAHPGILSAQYSATQHTLTVNLLCGPDYAPNPKTHCAYGSTLYTQTFTNSNQPAQPVVASSINDGVTNPHVGDQLTYTVTATNTQNNSTAQGVTLTASLPANLNVTSTGGGTLNSNNTVFWNIGSLNGGQTATEQFTTTIASGQTGDPITTALQAQTTDNACQTTGSSCNVNDTDTIASAVKQWIGNQSVETDLTGWTGTYGGSPYVSITRDTTLGHNSNASIKVSALTGASNLSSGFNDNPRWVTHTTAGTTYTQSAWIKSSFVGQNFKMRLREWNGSTLVSDVIDSYTATDTNWHQLNQALTAAGSGNQLSFAVYGTGFSAGQWFNVDDFSITTPN